MRGQIDIFGREIQELDVEFSKLRTMPLADMLQGSPVGLEDVEPTDWLRYEGWMAVTYYKPGAAVDSTDGMEKGRYGMTYFMQPLQVGLKVTGKLAKKDREEKWIADTEAG